MKSIDEKIEMLKSEIAALEAEKAGNPGTIGERIRKEMRLKGISGADMAQKKNPCGDARSDRKRAWGIVRLFDLWGGKRCVNTSRC